jgi:hypothetical protein
MGKGGKTGTRISIKEITILEQRLSQRFCLPAPFSKEEVAILINIPPHLAQQKAHNDYARTQTQKCSGIIQFVK